MRRLGRLAAFALFASTAHAAPPAPGLELRAPAEVSVLECTPAVTTLSLRNTGDTPLRMCRPDFYNLSVQFEPQPAAAAGPFLEGLYSTKASFVDAIDLPPGGSRALRPWLCERFEATLLPGVWTVTVEYRPDPGKDDWDLTPTLWRNRVVSSPIRVVVHPPRTARDQAALALYRQEGVVPRRLWRRWYDPPGWVGPGELWDALLDAPRAARLLADAGPGPLGELCAALWPRAGELITRLATAEAATPKDVLALCGALNERVILGPPLLERGAQAPDGSSPTTAALLALPAEGFDQALLNRARLEDLLPGCLPRQAMAVAMEFPDTPYAPTALWRLQSWFNSSGLYDPRLSLYWADRQLADYPEFALVDWIRAARCRALFALDRLDEVDAELPRFENGRFHVMQLLTVRRERLAAGEAAP